MDTGIISLSDFEKKIQDIENDWSHFIQEDLSVEVIEVAKKLSKELAVRGADAIHLASARVICSKQIRLIEHSISPI